MAVDRIRRVRARGASRRRGACPSGLRHRLHADLPRERAGRLPRRDRAAFGPAPRTKGVLDHIEKERDEVLAAKTPRERTKEWTDIAILGLDGLMRSIKEQYPHHTADMVAATALRLILGKQQRNEARDWPDWRTLSEDVAIEHSRTAKEQAEKDRELRGKKVTPEYVNAVNEAKKILEAGETIDHAAQAGKINKDDIYDLHLLTAKPFIYVFNVDDAELSNEQLRKKLPIWWPLRRRFSSTPSSKLI